MSLLDSTQGLKRVNSRQNNTELIALTLRRSTSLLTYNLTILHPKISREPLLGFLRCTHILPDLLSMMISIPNTQGLKKCVVLLTVGPKIWNSLPSDMRNLAKSTFRKKIRNKLFEILSESDDYLEITEIMHQLKFN